MRTTTACVSPNTYTIVVADTNIREIVHVDAVESYLRVFFFAFYKTHCLLHAVEGLPNTVIAGNAYYNNSVALWYFSVRNATSRRTARRTKRGIKKKKQKNG